MTLPFTFPELRDFVRMLGDLGMTSHRYMFDFKTEARDIDSRFKVEAVRHSGSVVRRTNEVAVLSAGPVMQRVTVLWRVYRLGM